MSILYTIVTTCQLIIQGQCFDMIIVDTTGWEAGAEARVEAWWFNDAELWLQEDSVVISLPRVQAHLLSHDPKSLRYCEQVEKPKHQVGSLICKGI